MLYKCFLNQFAKRNKTEHDASMESNVAPTQGSSQPARCKWLRLHAIQQTRQASKGGSPSQDFCEESLRARQLGAHLAELRAPGSRPAVLLHLPFTKCWWYTCRLLSLDASASNLGPLNPTNQPLTCESLMQLEAAHVRSKCT